MKSTGVLRRIDDLGRIVIPKEIRKHLKIKNGESLEIFINDDAVILKKYSYMSDLYDVAQNCSDSFYDVVNHDIIITDLNNVIAASGPSKRKYLNKEISSFINNMIMERKNTIEGITDETEIIKGEKEVCNFIVSPVIVSGDAVGSVIIISDSKISDLIEKTSNFIARFLGKHLE